MKSTLLLANIGEMATPIGHSAVQGAAMRDIHVVKDAVLVMDVDTIVWAGPACELPSIDGPVACRWPVLHGDT